MGFLSLQHHHSKLLLFLLTGINPSLIGLFRGMCALVGFIATFLSASIISKLGVLKVGITSCGLENNRMLINVDIYGRCPVSSHFSTFKQYAHSIITQHRF
jgi:hypothetical protein